MKRVRIILVLLSIAIAGVVMWKLLTRQPEPVYHGRTVDAWLDDMTNNSFRFPRASGDSDYRDALAHLGSRAVPFIFHKLEQNDSPFINKYRDIWPKLPGLLRKCLPQPKPISFDATTAASALGYCGTNAITLVINKRNSGNPAVREAVWETVFSFVVSRSISTNETLSLCLPALKDQDAEVRLYAAMSLGHMGAAASNAVRALIPLLSSSEAGRHPSERIFVRANTALTLGHMGPAASNAIPDLTNLVATGDSYARMSAAVALWQITSNENLSLPVIMKELPAFYINSIHLPANALKEMGPRAKAAFPLLLSELPRATDGYQRGTIINALKAIDPEAAAKAGIK
jgi:HEAT repeat protein